MDIEHFLKLDDTAETEITTLTNKIAVLKASIESTQDKESNILSAIEAGAKFQQFEVRARQLEQERVHIESELQSTQKKYDQLVSAKVDITIVRATIENLVLRMNELTGTDLYDLRAELSQQIKRLIGRIAIYAGGYIEKPKYITALRKHLLTKGLSAEEVSQHIAAKHNLEPNAAERFFITASRTGSIRMIRPSATNPEILHFETPGPNISENIITHLDGIGALTEVLKSRIR